MSSVGSPPTSPCSCHCSLSLSQISARLLPSPSAASGPAPLQSSRQWPPPLLLQLLRLTLPPSRHPSRPRPLRLPPPPFQSCRPSHLRPPFRLTQTSQAPCSPNLPIIPNRVMPLLPLLLPGLIPLVDSPLPLLLLPRGTQSSHPPLCSASMLAEEVWEASIPRHSFFTGPLTPSRGVWDQKPHLGRPRFNRRYRSGSAAWARGLNHVKYLTDAFASTFTHGYLICLEMFLSNQVPVLPPGLNSALTGRVPPESPGGAHREARPPHHGRVHGKVFSPRYSPTPLSFPSQANCSHGIPMLITICPHANPYLVLTSPRPSSRRPPPASCLSSPF